MLRLDGEIVTDANLTTSTNQPLIDFIRFLPMLAHQNIPKQTDEIIENITNDLGNVKFSSPEGFSSFSFHPLGIPGYDNFTFNRWTDKFLVPKS